MENQVKHKVGDIVYFFFNKTECRRCIIFAIQNDYSNPITKEDANGLKYKTRHIHYQLRKHHGDFIDDEIFDPGLANYPRKDNWIPIEMIYSEEDFFKIYEKEIQACSQDSCELVNSFLNNEETHNEKFLKKDLKRLTKELKKQKVLLKAVKILVKQYNHLDDLLRLTNINILSRMIELKNHIKETEKSLNNITWQ